MTRNETMRAVLGLKPGEEAREYEAGPVIEVPGGPACEHSGAQTGAMMMVHGVRCCVLCASPVRADGTDFPGESSMGAPQWADGATHKPGGRR